MARHRTTRMSSATRTSRKPSVRSGSEPLVGRYAIDTGVADLTREPGPPAHWLVQVNGVPSSAICPTDPSWLGFEYQQVMAAVLEVARPGEALRVVHVGAAACALPWALHLSHPGSRQLAVDLDARLLELARQWFDLPRAPHLRLRAGEGRAVLATRPAASTDVVIRDAFDGAITPVALRTTGMCAEVERILAPGGLYLANIADRPPLALVKDEILTAATVFTHVAVIAETQVLRGRRYGNLILVAGHEPVDVTGLVPALSRTGLALRVVHRDQLADLARGGRPLFDESATVPAHVLDDC